MRRRAADTSLSFLPLLLAAFAVLSACTPATTKQVAKEQPASAPPAPTEASVTTRIAELDATEGSLNDLVRIFGEPREYAWGSDRFTRDNLPSKYLARYDDGLSFLMGWGVVRDIRFQKKDLGYAFEGKLRIGSSIEEALAVLGPPARVEQGEPNHLEDAVLYRDISGARGRAYYGREDRHVRIFFTDDKISGLELRREYLFHRRAENIVAAVPERHAPKPVPAAISVHEFDDVRGKDLSGTPPALLPSFLTTLTFNDATVWPDASRSGLGELSNRMKTLGMNPGLGVQGIHKNGVTGKGVNVAIIDQPLQPDHPEFEGKIAEYRDFDCGSGYSMHGPAVASLLVGSNCGTAPDARLYFAAVPMWNKDAACFADALRWILRCNEKLPPEQRIRIVSVSACPSGYGSPFERNGEQWDRTCAEAEATGVLVLDCTQHRGVVGRCWYDINAPEDPSRCTPGAPGESPGFRPGAILAPTSCRTTAEQLEGEKPSYIYWGEGGLSWAIPYTAGVLALGQQVRPDLSARQLLDVLARTAFLRPDGSRIINPAGFIQALTAPPPEKKARVSRGPFADRK